MSDKTKYSRSRRHFLQTGSTALAMWMAGRGRLAQGATTKLGPLTGERPAWRGFIYGTEFYYPQDVRPQQFRSLLGDIATKYQFNIVRIFPPWDYYNPKPGEYSFDDLEELLRVCDELGIKVLMTVMLECAPYWLEEMHPETRFTNAAGHVIPLEGTSDHYTGGSPGLCSDWEPVRAAAEQFVRALVGVSKRHPATYAYDIWNEPSAYVDLSGKELDANIRIPENLFCYCNRSLTVFRQWLQGRYGSLDKLNQAWVRKHPDWSSVNPPRNHLGTYADWLDWLHFRQERATEQLKFRAALVRQIDPDRLIETHVAYAPAVGPVALRGIQAWRLAEAVDTFGCSLYASAAGWRIDQGAAQLEIARSCAAGKDFWVSEMQGGHTNAGVQQTAPLPPRALRVWNWLALAAGAKGIVYWSYLAEGTTAEASGFGLVERDGAATDRAAEAAKVNRLIQARSDLVESYRPQPNVAILFDQDNALFTFAGNGKEEPSMQSIAGYYRAFWSLDTWVDCIEPTRINDPQYRVLIAPWHLIGKKATCEALRAFVERGGTLILEAGFARFDERFYFNPVVPSHGLDEVFGYRELESIPIAGGQLPLDALELAPTDADSYEATIEFTSPATVRLKAHTFLTPIETRSALPIARCGRWTVAATRMLGQGRVFYLGTDLGGSISQATPGGIELVRALLSGIVQPAASCTGALRPRLIQGPRHGLLIVFNDTDTHQRGTISLPTDYRYAIDVYTSQRRAITNRKVELDVPFKDVAVFDLE